MKKKRKKSAPVKRGKKDLRDGWIALHRKLPFDTHLRLQRMAGELKLEICEVLDMALDELEEKMDFAEREAGKT